MLLFVLVKTTPYIFEWFNHDLCTLRFYRPHLQGTKVLFTNPSARAGYDTRSIFKRSLTGLNSEFSFS